MPMAYTHECECCGAISVTFWSVVLFERQKGTWMGGGGQNWVLWSGDRELKCPIWLTKKFQWDESNIYKYFKFYNPHVWKHEQGIKQWSQNPFYCPCSVFTAILEYTRVNSAISQRYWTSSHNSKLELESKRTHWSRYQLCSQNIKNGIVLLFLWVKSKIWKTYWLFWTWSIHMLLTSLNP